MQVENTHCWKKTNENDENVVWYSLDSLLLYLTISFNCNVGFLLTSSQFVHGLFIEVARGCLGHPFAFISLLVLKEVKANDWYK